MSDLETVCYFSGRSAVGKDGTERCSEVTVIGHHCHGCDETICDNHEMNDTLSGAHFPEEHLESTAAAIDAEFSREP